MFKIVQKPLIYWMRSTLSVANWLVVQRNEIKSKGGSVAYPRNIYWKLVLFQIFLAKFVSFSNSNHPHPYPILITFQAISSISGFQSSSSNSSLVKCCLLLSHVFSLYHRIDLRYIRTNLYDCEKFIILLDPYWRNFNSKIRPYSYHYTKTNASVKIDISIRSAGK